MLLGLKVSEMGETARQETMEEKALMVQPKLRKAENIVSLRPRGNRQEKSVKHTRSGTFLEGHGALIADVGAK